MHWILIKMGTSTFYIIYIISLIMTFHLSHKDRFDLVHFPPYLDVIFAKIPLRFSFKYQCLQQEFLIDAIAGINFIHNHPPRTPGDLHQKFAPTMGLLHTSFCLGGFVGIAPEGRAFVKNDFCHFWNFHHNDKNWRLTTLWGLFVALKFYVLKKIIQS